MRQDNFKSKKYKFTSCKICNCSWANHKYITKTYEQVKKQAINPSIQQEIRTREEAIQVIEKSLITMEQFVKELENELEVINEVAAKFTYILNHNSNTVCK